MTKREHEALTKLMDAGRDAICELSAYTDGHENRSVMATISKLEKALGNAWQVLYKKEGKD